MKKIILLITLLLIGFTFGAYAKKVDIKEAKLAGKNFYFEHVNVHKPVSYESVVIVEEFVEKDGNGPLYYIFNFNDGGFIIVTADDACSPILGYSFETSYKSGYHSDAFLSMMDKFKREILYARENNLLPDETITSTWARLTSTDNRQIRNPETITAVEPLISNNWNQDFPYNALVPEDPNSGGTYNGNCPVGCTATSMTQIMYYWRYPTQGQGYHCIWPTPSYGPQCADFGATTYDWDGMAQQPTSECNPVAILSWHGGISVDMNYGPDGSGASTQKVPNALKNYFLYDQSAYYQNRPTGSSIAWKNTMKQNIDNGLPLQYTGFAPTVGHAFVCDGYQDNDYFHFNFGWGGQDNGYYTIDNINPGGTTFNDDQAAVFNIKPDPAYYPYGCTGSVADTVYDFGTFEDGSGPIADYQNNLNCSWLIGADDSLESITLSFVRFNTLAGDEVKVYDGENASAPLLGTFSGTNIPSAVTSTGGKLFVTFTTDGSGVAPGWLASYQGTPVSFCGSLTTLTAASGDINDGSGRFEYRNSTNCKWKIQPDNAATVTLTFNNFNTELNADKLQVYDLGAGSLLATYSGEYSTPPPPLTASSGKMMLIWNADKTIRGTGWDASYTITVGTEEKENFTSLSVYPNPVDDNLHIQFNLSEPQNVKIEIISAKGVTLYTEQFSYFKGDFQKTVDVSSFAKGIYLLRMTGDRGMVNEKIIVQ